MNLSDILPKLRWQCRRGMLELDVLLGQFLEEAYLGLNPEDQLIFANLLKCNDQELFYWFTGQKEPDDPQLAAMVKKVKQHANNRH